MLHCEQVKDLLSPYLDCVLAEEERRVVAEHLELCSECRALLADFRRFDILLSQLSRVSPRSSLRESIFSSPEYLELIGNTAIQGKSLEQTVPYKSVRTTTASQAQHSHLVALPGGRQNKDQRSSLQAGTQSNSLTTPARTVASKPRQKRWGQRVLQTALVASVLLVISVGGLIGWNLWQRQNSLTSTTGVITPPAGLQQGPIPAGVRILFLRNGALWSAPTDGSTAIVRLTPAHATVASQWTVRPTQPPDHAGNMVAYIDLQQGFVHLIRSDGQNDSIIQQPLLKQGVQPATVWNTTTGTTILNSLVWSNDGSKLAFVADPTGAAQPGLYIYTVSTNELHNVALPSAGTVSHLVWSPDSIRVAFEVALNGNSTLLDYNTQDRGILTLPTSANTQTTGGDTVLALQWSPNTAAPALTWSLGQAGQVHSIWTQRVGIAGTTKPTLLASGTFTQAEYNQAGHNGIGSWLLVSANADIMSVDLTAFMTRLTTGKQVQEAQWSPDGNSVAYFEALANGMGMFSVVDARTGTDTLIAAKAATEPFPAWSTDSQHIAYSTGTDVLIVAVHTPGTSQALKQLKQQGRAVTLSWSSSSPSQLIVATGGGQPGLYLVDTQHETSQQLAKEAIQGSILWTQIP